MLYCRSCKRTLSIDSFYIRKTGKEKDKPIKPCKKCMREKQKEYVRSPKGRLTYRRKHLKNNFDLTIEQYNQMFVDQNGVCAICGNINTKGHRLCVDHNHKTGKVRGLLCVFCNIFAGYIEKYPEKIKQIKSYLEEN